MRGGLTCAQHRAIRMLRSEGILVTRSRNGESSTVKLVELGVVDPISKKTRESLAGRGLVKERWCGEKDAFVLTLTAAGAAVKSTGE